MRHRTQTLIVTLALLVASVAGATPALAQSGMTGVPNEKVTAEMPDGEDPPIPAEDLQGRIEASRHASTLEVTVTTPSHAESLLDDNATVVGTGDLALLLADDSNHDGRDVALPAKPVVQALGYAPEQVRGLHSSGSEWSSEVRYVDNQMVFYVPEFSSNTVTFTGTVEIEGNPATDGSSYTYSVSDPDAVEDFSINVTGRTVQERDMESATVTDGGSMSISVAGTTDPQNPEVTLVGVETRQNNSWSGTGVTGGSTRSITVGGNVPPENAQITFTGSREETSRTVSTGSVSSGATKSYSVGGNVAPENERVTFYGESSSNSRSVSGSGSKSYTVGGNLEPSSEEVIFTGITQTTSETDGGTRVAAGRQQSLNNGGNLVPTGPASGDPRLSITTYENRNTFGRTDSAGCTVSETYTNVPSYVNSMTAEWGNRQTSSDGDGRIRVYVDGTKIAERTEYKFGEGVGGGNFNPDTTVANSITVEVDFGISGGPSNCGRATIDNVVFSSGTPNVDVTADDGTSHSFDAMGDGESLSTAFPISENADSITLDSKGGSFDWSLEYTKRTATEDPGLDVDGDGTDEASYNGILTEGQTATKSVDLSTGSQTAVPSTYEGAVSWQLDFTEKTGTENPAVDLDGDGSAEASYSGVLSSGETASRSVQLERGSATAETTLSGGSVSWDLDYTEVTATKNPSVDLGGARGDEVSISQTLDAGESVTTQLAGREETSELSAGSNTLTFGGSGAPYDYTLEATERTHTEDPSVDTDGDDVGEVSYSGILGPGETATSDAPAIDSQSSSLDVGTGAGDVTVEAAYTEVVQTSDLTVEINGQETSYAGTLSDGEQVQLQTDPEWVRNGTNRVNVSISSPGGDAPPALAGFNYSHDALDQQAVAYDAETFSERYEVSKIFSEGRSNAQLSIPFKGEVLSIRTIERQQSDGSWSAVSPSDYSFDGTELTVDLGRTESGETVAVRAVGTKARVEGGSIRVTETTTAGQSLDSQLKLTNWTDGAYIELPNGTSTENGALVHHGYAESYTGASDYVEISDSGEQRLYLPKASDQSTVRVKTIPVAVNARSGEVEVSVSNAVSSGEPTFNVRPGDSVQDEVEFTFVEAQGGEDYVLYSETMGIQRDSGTANSPVTLVDDDSDETLVIRPDSSGNATSSRTGGVPMIGIESARETAENTPIVLVVGVVLIVALYYLFRRMGWLQERDGLLPVSPVFAGAAGLIGFVVIDFASGRRLTAALGSGLSQIVPLAGIVGVALAAWWAYRRFIKGSGPRPIQIVGRGGGGQ